MSDTTDNCVTLNQTVFVVKEKDTTVWEPSTSGSGGYTIRVLQTTGNPRQVVTLSATMEGLVFDFFDTAASGSTVVVERDLAVTANVAQEVSMGLAIAQGTFVLQAVEEVNGNERLLASVTQQAGDVTTDGGGMHTQSFQLRILPSTGNIKLRLSTIPMQVGNRSTATGRWVVKKIKYLEQQNIAVTLCDSTADRYRFGFNGQEKVNEIAGIGNHNTAEFWEYDTRLGRRWNLDPVDQISISNYAVNGLNPIWFNDPNGDLFDKTNGKKAEKMEKKIDKKIIDLKKSKTDPDYLVERIEELEKSKRDLKDMKLDPDNYYVFKRGKIPGIFRNPKNEKIVEIISDGTDANKIHEIRHGGQAARREIDIRVNAFYGYGVKKEVDAYKAQFGYVGYVEYSTGPYEVPQELLRQNLKEGKDVFTRKLINYFEIDSDFVNGMQFNNKPLYPPPGFDPRYWNKN